MKTREIIILILLLAAGIFFTHVRTGRIHFDWEDYIALDWNAYTFEESGILEGPLPALLKVTNVHGSVEIVGTSEDRIVFTLKKKVWRRTEEKARQVAEKLHPVMTRDEASVSLSTNREEFRKRNFQTSFRITCPENMAVELRNSYGLAKVEAVGNCSIVNPHGQVVATDIRGEFELENSYEAVSLENIQSNCRLKSRHADVSAKSVEGEVMIETRHGRVELRRVQKNVRINAPHTPITGEDLSASVEIQNSYEPIFLARVGPVDIQARHSPIQAEEVRGDLRIRNDYARVDFGQVHGDVWISGRSLAIAGRDITAKEIYLSSAYEDIELSDFSGKTTIFISHGKVSLSPLPLVGPLEVRGEYSPILFFWPPGERYPLEAQTKNGDISWRLPEEIRIDEENSLSIVRAFTELADRPRILLVTTYSDIRIDEGSGR